jgi:hypothetical protein
MNNHDAAEHEEPERHDDVHPADLLVIDGREPFVGARAATQAWGSAVVAISGSLRDERDHAVTSSSNRRGGSAVEVVVARLPAPRR